jgi:phospholipase A-2-activating protein
MVRNGASVEAHQWTQATQSWTKIGDVVDAVGSDRKQVFEGREYDYVFNVDITDGAPPLKLPYNVGENPYMVAQQFIHRNELPQDYLDQIADFITKNTKSVTLGAVPPPASTNQYVDPFTGAGRYVPGGAGTVPATSAYSAPAPSSVINPDPFTGSHASVPVHPKSTKIVPLDENGFLTFKAANLSACLKKIQELNQAVPAV